MFAPFDEPFEIEPVSTDPSIINSLETEPLTRRRFLTTAGQGIAAAGMIGGLSSGTLAAQNPPAIAPGANTPIALPEISAPTETSHGKPPTPLPPDSRVRFAIVGLGHLSLEEILPAFAHSKRCRLTALVSGDRAKAETVARQYGIAAKNIYDYKNYDSLRDNPEVDVIYIVLPNSMHAEYTVRGAQAGKHILCEKPMATSVRECQQMIDACRKADRRLMIAYRIQYEPYNYTMQQMLRGSEFGKVKVIEMINGQNQGGDLNQWRLKKALAGGGSLPDVGLYCLNTARFLTGEEPIEIVAHEYTTPNDPRFREVEETVNWTMRFPSGITANCSTSYGFHEVRRYRVMGEQSWGQMDPAFSYSGLRQILGHKSRDNDMMEAVEERRMAEKNQFALEMDHMAECVQENKTPYTPGEEGLQDHRLMATIYESGRSGRTVKLPPVTKQDAFRGTPPTRMI